MKKTKRAKRIRYHINLWCPALDILVSLAIVDWRRPPEESNSSSISPSKLFCVRTSFPMSIDKDFKART